MSFWLSSEEVFDNISFISFETLSFGSLMDKMVMVEKRVTVKKLSRDVFDIVRADCALFCCQHGGIRFNVDIRELREAFDEASRIPRCVRLGLPGFISGIIVTNTVFKILTFEEISMPLCAFLLNCRENELVKKIKNLKDQEAWPIIRRLCCTQRI